MLEKVAEIKRFEYSPLGKELKNQTSVTEKQYPKFGNAFKSNKKEENKRSRAKSNLVYNNYFIFYKYSKLDDLKEFKDKLELFYYNPQNLSQIMKTI